MTPKKYKRKITGKDVHKYVDAKRWAAMIAKCAELAQQLKS